MEYLSAIKKFEDAQSLSNIKEQYEILVKIGDNYASLKEYPLAEEKYRSAIQLETSNPFAWTKLVCILYAERKYEKVINICSELILKGITNAIIYLKLGPSYYFKKNIEKAELFINKAIETDSKYSHAITALGAIYSDCKNDYTKARNCYLAALKIEPCSMYTRLNLAEAEFLLKNYKKTERYSKHVKDKTDSVNLW